MYFCTMKNRKEIIKGSNDRNILMDITFPVKSNNKLIIFSHGFKGFKDWGCFSLMSKIFAQNGFTFLKLSTTTKTSSLSFSACFIFPSATRSIIFFVFL